MLKTLFSGPYMQPAIDPVALSLGIFDIRWYSLAYVVGLLGALYYSLFIAGRTNTAIGKKHIDDFFVWLVIGVMVGGRLGYVLFYGLPYYLQNPIEALYIWQGGMSFHGGALGVIIACWLYCYRRGLSFTQYADMWICAMPIGLFFGRLANFVNGELYGRVTDVPWAVIFMHSDGQPRHPSQLYEALLEGLLLFIIMNIALWKYQMWRYPGWLSGLFLMGYGVGRTAVEFVREPDAHIGFIVQISGLGITMGQLLSSVMIVAGTALMIHAQRQPPLNP